MFSRSMQALAFNVALMYWIQQSDLINIDEASQVLQSMSNARDVGKANLLAQ